MFHKQDSDFSERVLELLYTSYWVDLSSINSEMEKHSIIWLHIVYILMTCIHGN
jgi:hypothetical protein